MRQRFVFVGLPVSDVTTPVTLLFGSSSIYLHNYISYLTLRNEKDFHVLYHKLVDVCYACLKIGNPCCYIIWLFQSWYVLLWQRILEINSEYQEKLSSLRALQATRQEEFLHKELKARLKQHHEAKRNHCHNRKAPDAYGHVCPPTFTSGEAIGSRFNGAIEYKHNGERTLRWTSGGSCPWSCLQ